MGSLRGIKLGAVCLMVRCTHVDGEERECVCVKERMKLHMARYAANSILRGQKHTPSILVWRKYSYVYHPLDSTTEPNETIPDPVKRRKKDGKKKKRLQKRPDTFMPP